jgi:hypothetical protein
MKQNLCAIRNANFKRIPIIAGCCGAAYKILRTAFETFRKHANLPDVAERF